MGIFNPPNLGNYIGNINVTGYVIASEGIFAGEYFQTNGPITIGGDTETIGNCTFAQVGGHITVNIPNANPGLNQGELYYDPVTKIVKLDIA